MDVAQIKISVIIPVFNKQEFLGNCIESVLNQSFKDYEIILIDDGSTDDSPLICDNYGERYEFIHVFHRNNGGLGPARNFGIEIASGKYMLFLDSDDWFEKTTLEQLYYKAEKDNVDAVFFDFMLADCETNRIFRSYENANYLDCEVFFEAKMRRCMLPSSCTIMYKRERWEELELQFPNTPFEDNALYPLILLGFANKSILNAGLYYYRTHYGETITCSLSNDLRRFEPFEFLVKELRKKKIFERYKEDIYHFCYNQLKVSLDVIKNKSDKELYLKCLKNFNKFLENNFGEMKMLEKEDINNIRISVIVPVHNSEKYLEECLNSLRCQSLKEIEIICIDDNSIDGTNKIIENYINKDCRFHLINDINGSYGHKINKGIQRAQGKYIAILESDDFYAEEALECLYMAIENTNADYVDADFIEIRNVGKKYYYEYSSKYFETNKYDSVIYGNENRRALRSGTSAIWTGLYRKKFIIENEITLNESAGASFQDISFRFLVCCASRCSYHLQKGLYYYRTDNESSSSHDDAKVMNIVDEYKYLKNELDKRGWLIGEIIGYYYFWKYTGYFWNVKRLSYEANREFISHFLAEMDREKDKLRICWEQLRPDICSILLNFRQNPYIVLAEEKDREEKKRIDKKRNDGYAVFAQKGNIVIFGSGRLGNRVLQMLGNERENIIYFCDNDSQKWGQYIDGIEVVSPKFLQTNFDNVNYIVANKYHSEDIRKQLNLLGVSDEKICIYC